jgi:hypothetical protein
VTQLGCPNCGTGLTGSFESCEFCGLDQADRDLLRVFLASRGNMKELERHLGVSYPTARARFEDLLRKLGLSSGAATPAASAASAASAGSTASTGPATASSASARAAADARLEVLRAVAAGDVDVDRARDALAGPGPGPGAGA